MQRLTSLSFLTALVSLSLAGGCSKSDSGSPAAQEPVASPAPGPQAEEPGREVAGGGDRRDLRNMSPDERRAARREERMRRFDTDGDGRLSRPEREAMRTAMVDMRMQRIDVDGDGRISRQEAQGKRIGQRLLADFDRADANRDSTISRDELAAAIDELRARRRAERQQAGGAAAAPGTGPAAPPAEEEYGDPLDDE